MPNRGGSNASRGRGTSPSSPNRQSQPFIPTPSRGRGSPNRGGPPPKPPKGRDNEAKPIPTQFRQSMSALPHEKLKNSSELPPLPPIPNKPKQGGPPTLPVKPNAARSPEKKLPSRPPPIPDKPLVNLPVLPRSRMLSVSELKKKPDTTADASPVATPDTPLSPGAVKRASVALQKLNLRVPSTSPESPNESKAEAKLSSPRDNHEELRPDLRKSIKRVGSMRFLKRKPVSTIGRRWVIDCSIFIGY